MEKDGRYRVSTARNGDEALEAMRQSHPDLILLDIMMTTPLEGVSLAKQVSRDAALSKIPVIVISGIDESEYASLIPDDKVLPIDAWISKPIDPDHLLRTVQRFLA